jgi:hypothetical protein
MSLSEMKENPFSIHEQPTLLFSADIAPPVSDQLCACA